MEISPRILFDFRTDIEAKIRIDLYESQLQENSIVLIMLFVKYVSRPEANICRSANALIEEGSWIALTNKLFKDLATAMN